MAGLSRILLWFGNRKFVTTNDINAAKNGLRTDDIKIDQVYRSTSTKGQVSVPQTMKVKRRKGITTVREKSDRYEIVLTRREALSIPKRPRNPLGNICSLPIRQKWLLQN
jgi:hypothetical protein